MASRALAFVDDDRLCLSFLRVSACLRWSLRGNQPDNAANSGLLRNVFPFEDAAPTAGAVTGPTPLLRFTATAKCI
jgi:hypothetical protein